MVKVLAFAGAKEAIGRDEFEVALEAPTSARAFLRRICEEHPKLKPYEGALRVAVNGGYAAWDEVVKDGDEVAIIPPVAGG